MWGLAVPPMRSNPPAATPMPADLMLPVTVSWTFSRWSLYSCFTLRDKAVGGGGTTGMCTRAHVMMQLMHVIGAPTAQIL